MTYEAEVFIWKRGSIFRIAIKKNCQGFFYYKHNTAYTIRWVYLYILCVHTLIHSMLRCQCIIIVTLRNKLEPGRYRNALWGPMTIKKWTNIRAMSRPRSVKIISVFHINRHAIIIFIPTVPLSELCNRKVQKTQLWLLHQLT